MLITNKSRYAALALFDLASNSNSGHVNLSELSGRYGISVSYLEQIFARLRTEGLVASARGPGGGYRLARPATSIRLAEILALFDRDDSDEPGPAVTSGNGTSQRMWRQFDNRLRTFLTTLTLADLMSTGNGSRTTSGSKSRSLASTSL
jgi:Rrf2 family iron-sulfur cluster assembly transcriptional regulator